MPSDDLSASELFEDIEEKSEADLAEEALLRNSDIEVEEQEPSAEDLELAKLIDPNYRWYIVSVYAGLEDSVKVNLLGRIKKSQLEDLFKDVMIPKILVEKVLKSGRKMVEKTSFPGYIFIQANLTEQAYSIVLNTPRVIGFLGNYKKPRPMSDKDVLHFLGTASEEKKPTKQTAPRVVFEKNQPIKVTGGPFANFEGIVDEVKPDKMKLTVLVSILGRETPVELDFDQVKKIDL